MTQYNIVGDDSTGIVYQAKFGTSVPLHGSIAALATINATTLSTLDASCVSLGIPLLIDTDLVLAGPQSFSADVIAAGGIINQGGFTLTFAGRFNAPPDLQTFAKGNIGTLTLPSTAVVTATNLGASGDGTTDDSLEFMKGMRSGASVRLHARTYAWTTFRSIGSPTPINLIGERGSIVKLSAKSLFIIQNTANIKVSGISFVGPVASNVQWKIMPLSLGDYFTSPTYNDGSNSISGNDFQHDLSSDKKILTIGLSQTYFGTVTRNVLSSSISLDPNAKYIIDLEPGFVRGDGFNKPRFLLLDASGNPLTAPLYPNSSNPRYLGGYYEPNDSRSYFSVIAGASSIKISLGAFRLDQTATGLSATFDMTKLKIYQIINQLGDFDINVYGPPENSGMVTFHNTSQITIEDCSFSRANSAALLITSAPNTLLSDLRISNCRVKESFGGISIHPSEGVIIQGGSIDLRFAIDSGGYLGQRFLRNRGISAGAADKLLITACQIRGSSWGMELKADADAISQEVMSNDITAEYCGISSATLGNGPGTGSRVIGNIIRISPTGLMCLEAAGTTSLQHWGVFQANVLQVADIYYLTYGIAVSKNTSLDVIGNKIFAPIGLASPVTSGTIRMIDNSIDYGFSMFWGSGGQVLFSNNTGRLVRNAHIFGNQIPAIIYYDATSNPDSIVEIIGNIIDSGATYDIYVPPSKGYIISGNTINDRPPFYTGKTYSIRALPHPTIPTMGIVSNNILNFCTAASPIDAPAGVAGSHTPTLSGNNIVVP